MSDSLIEWVESGRVPDFLVRAGIRRLLEKRLAAEDPGDGARRQQKLERWLAAMRASPVAIAVEKANEQHYEVPAAFFEKVLGPRLKYSSCLFPNASTSLARAEEAMLELTCERAELGDGQEVLELGCGWGSLTLFAAERFPRSRITGVSNSASQRAFIEARAAQRGLRNVRIVTADMNGFDPGARFDRVVSVEMFEHMRNWEELLSRIAGWLRDDGRLFLHVFCHRELPYPFEDKESDDWMARHFFTGGMMPSDALLLRLQRDLLIDAHWRVNGSHYATSSEAWIERMEQQKGELIALLDANGAAAHGGGARVFMRWKLFFLACAELFGFRNGEEWFVAHYRMTRRAAPQRAR